MPQLFPTSPLFPAPNWIDNFKPGSTPSVNQSLSNKTISRLRISEIQSGAEFTASWNGINYDLVQTFLRFWQLVDTWNSFSLPMEFWDLNMPTTKRDIIIAASPTGYWQFKEIPKFEDYNLKDQAITAIFVGVIN